MGILIFHNQYIYLFLHRFLLRGTNSTIEVEGYYVVKQERKRKRKLLDTLYKLHCQKKKERELSMILARGETNQQDMKALKQWHYFFNKYIR